MRLDTPRPRADSARDESCCLTLRARVGAGFGARANRFLPPANVWSQPSNAGELRVSWAPLEHPSTPFEPLRATQLQFLHRIFLRRNLSPHPYTSMSFIYYHIPNTMISSSSSFTSSSTPSCEVIKLGIGRSFNA